MFGSSDDEADSGVAPAVPDMFESDNEDAPRTLPPATDMLVKTMKPTPLMTPPTTPPMSLPRICLALMRSPHLLHV